MKEQKTEQTKLTPITPDISQDWIGRTIDQLEQEIKKKKDLDPQYVAGWLAALEELKRRT